MNRIELVRAAFDLDNPDQLSYYTDDFQRTDETGSPPIGRDAWQATSELMKSAFPDLKMVIDDIREKGDGVVITSHLTGTFTNDFDLTPMGMGVVPATGKAVKFPTGTDQVRFDDGKICELHGLDTGPDTGMAGFFKALGVKMG